VIWPFASLLLETGLETDDISRCPLTENVGGAASWIAVSTAENSATLLKMKWKE
jgi:hypothetical protein